MFRSSIFMKKNTKELFTYPSHCHHSICAFTRIASIQQMVVLSLPRFHSNRESRIIHFFPLLEVWERTDGILFCRLIQFHSFHFLQLNSLYFCVRLSERMDYSIHEENCTKYFLRIHQKSDFHFSLSVYLFICVSKWIFVCTSFVLLFANDSKKYFQLGLRLRNVEYSFQFLCRVTHSRSRARRIYRENSFQAVRKVFERIRLL